MSKKQIEVESILTKIYSSIIDHYRQHGLVVDDLIKNDINTSKQNRKNEFIYKRLVFSIHNANWKAVSQETFWKNNSKHYEVALKNFNPEYVSKLKLDELKNKGLIKSDKRLQYCIDAAKFVVEIKAFSKSDIIAFFNKFAYEGSSVYERWALVNIIAQSVNGIGTALACDFLKETGFLNYGKPDIHIKRIFERIGIIDYFHKKTVYSNSDFFIFRILDILSNILKKSLFEVDKILWLFATGFNNTNGRAIGGICKDKPDCNVCKINSNCNYFSTEHNTT